MDPSSWCIDCEKPHDACVCGQKPAKVIALRRVRCRWCDWACAAFWTSRKSGKTYNGLNALHRHVEDEHPAEFDRIRAWARRTVLPPPRASLAPLRPMPAAPALAEERALRVVARVPTDTLPPGAAS